LNENSLLNKPQSIFINDESRIQLINKPGNVTAMKGAKNAHVLTPRERGQKVTVIACCKADEFHPLSLILKAVMRNKNLGGGGVVPMDRKCT
jgi:hypothetical protein